MIFAWKTCSRGQGNLRIGSQTMSHVILTTKFHGLCSQILESSPKEVKCHSQECAAFSLALEKCKDKKTMNNNSQLKMPPETGHSNNKLEVTSERWCPMAERKPEPELPPSPPCSRSVHFVTVDSKSPCFGKAKAADPWFWGPAVGSGKGNRVAHTPVS